MTLERIYRLTALRLLGCLLLAAVALLPGLALADSSGFYQQTNLVSDQPNVAQHQDAHLVNAWGISHAPTSPWWVSDNGEGVSTLYNSDGVPFPAATPLVVTIPVPPGGTPPSAPTGQVFNGVASAAPDEFIVKGTGFPSTFIFTTEDGTIAAWSNQQSDRTHAVLVADRSESGAVYKGLAMGRTGGHDFLYATNFHAGTIDVFDSQFQFVRSFTDVGLSKRCPLPNQCFAPFGIQNVDGQLFVTFALQDADKHDDTAGPGNGFVDIFDASGHMRRRFASRGTLNSPWGVAAAPEEFGRFSGALLVGNFGDGHINALDRRSGRFLGQLKDNAGKPLTIDGLWGLGFGNGSTAGPKTTLFFSAGPNHEANGLFGKIEAASGD